MTIKLRAMWQKFYLVKQMYDLIKIPNEKYTKYRQEAIENFLFCGIQYILENFIVTLHFA